VLVANRDSVPQYSATDKLVALRYLHAEQFMHALKEGDHMGRESTAADESRTTRTRRKSGGPKVAAFPIEETPLNPNHRKDFLRLLAAATASNKT